MRKKKHLLKLLLMVSVCLFNSWFIFGSDSGNNLFKFGMNLYQNQKYPGAVTVFTNFINKYPDLIFDLKDGYGAGWGLYEDLITDASSSNLVPGSHKIDTTTFLCSNLNKECIRENMTLMDIAPMILNLLGIDWKQFDFDGKSLFI